MEHSDDIIRFNQAISHLTYYQAYYLLGNNLINIIIQFNFHVTKQETTKTRFDNSC